LPFVTKYAIRTSERENGMSTKQQALAVARRFGFELDESVSGKVGMWFMITFDHPTHSIGGDCRSIHVEDISGAVAWAEAIERMESEGPLLERCADPECEYHNP
jgi:hypothetical protein